MKFQIQLFGTNDTVTSANNLYMGFNRRNDKVQYLTVPNPYDTITAEQAREIMEYIVDNKVIFDKEGDSFTSVFTAYREEILKRDFDLT